MKLTLKTIVSVVLSYLIVISVFPISSFVTNAAEIELQGEGTKVSPYLIYTSDDFVYAMEYYSANKEVYLSLENDIDVIKKYKPVSSFKATFDGNYHTVTSDVNFAQNNYGFIESLKYENQKYFESTEDCYQYAGFVFSNLSTISGVSVCANIMGSEGAIICFDNSGDILNCSAFGSSIMDDHDGAKAAGISVTNSGTISNCYVAAEIAATGGSRYGVSQSHPITIGAYENSYFDSTLCRLKYADGYSSEFMKTSDFINMLNKDCKATDSLWTKDVNNVNDGYPILCNAYNAVIKSSKQNIVINGTEYIELSCDDCDELRYTLDGSEPDTNSALYSEPIEISDSVTVIAKGYKNGNSGNSVRFEYVKINGNGTDDLPYIIDNEASFRSISELSLDACYEITEDIELTKELNTFGDFKGKIEGNNHTISSVWSSTYQFGLFKNNYGIIQNLRLSNSNQNYKTNGAFAYKNYGVISNCSFSGLVTGYVSDNNRYNYYNENEFYGLGGFVSFNYGKIIDSCLIGNLYVEEGNTIGGFVGVNDSVISNCIYKGDIYVDDLFFWSDSIYTNKVSGLVGHNTKNGYIEYSTATTNSIYVQTSSYAGGTAYTFASPSGTQTECSCQNSYITFSASYLEWGERKVVKQELSGLGYSEIQHSHNYVFTEKTNETCTDDGGGNIVCDDCGETVSFIIPKYGHNYTTTEVLPTYDSQGCIEHKCSRCGNVYYTDIIEPYKDITGSCGNSCTYSFDEDGTLIISGSGAMTNYKITNYTSGNELANTPWYAYRKIIKKVIIEDGITSIGNTAFFNFINLTEVNCPDTLTTIGEYAFRKCTAITTPPIFDNVTTIGNGAFMDCSGITSIIVPNGVTTIGYSAFRSCTSLENIVIPDGVTNIGNCTFKDCTNLKTITLPNSINAIGNNAFQHCGNLVKIEIPDGVENIGEYAFSGCVKLENVSIPYGITSIERNTFENCQSFTDITIPNSVTTIQFDAFYNCSGLTKLVISNSVQSIISPFDHCNNLTIYGIPHSKAQICATKDNIPFVEYMDCLYETPVSSFEYEVQNGNIIITKFIGEETNIYIPVNINGNPVTAIGENAFQDSKIVNVIISDNIKNIGDYSFQRCSELTSIAIPDTVTYMGKYSFYGCTKLSNIDLPNGITSIEDYSFSNCSNLSNVTIPDTVLSIGLHSFSSCGKLTSIIIPNNTTYIGKRAFSNCNGLTKITIPDNVTSIADYCFYKCNGLTSVSIGNSVTDIGSYAFSECTELKTISFGNNVANIGEKAFYKCTKLTDVVITDSVENVGAYAFSDCTGLKSVKLGNGLTKIPTGMFSNCTGLTNVLLPESVLTINPNAFLNCYYLKSIEIPNSVISIYDYAFSKCTGLTEIVIPDSVKTIYGYAFSKCTGLQSVTIGRGITNITDSAFTGCSRLSEIVIPDSVTKIGYSAFKDCIALKKVLIPDSVTSISTSAFSGCEKLTIFGSSNSYAKKFSTNNSIPFEVSITDVKEQPSNCVSVGKQGYFINNYNGKFYENSDCTIEISDINSWGIIPATGHSYTTEIVASTCTEQGYTIHTCLVCGDTYKDNYTAKLLTNTSTLSAEKIKLGEQITANGSATGGTEKYLYQVVYKQSTQSKWTTAQSYNTNANVSFKPAKATIYDVCVKVKDSNGTEVKKFFTINVIDKLKNTSTLSATTIYLGGKITANGSATGGTGKYSYQIVYKQSTQSKWTTAQSYNTNTNVSFKPAKATIYDVCIKVKDSDGAEVKKFFTVNVEMDTLKNESTISETTINLGGMVTVNAKATGSTGFYTYAVYYKKTSESKWTIKQEFKTNNIIDVKPAKATTYDICVKVKDDKGTVVKKYFEVNVTNFINTSELSTTEIQLGDTVKVSCSATGSTDFYQYAVYYKKTSNTKWTTKQTYSSNNAVTIKPTSATTYDICVKVKDNQNNEAKKYFIVTVK